MWLTDTAGVNEDVIQLASYKDGLLAGSARSAPHRHDRGVLTTGPDPASHEAAA